VHVNKKVGLQLATNGKELLNPRYPCGTEHGLSKDNVLALRAFNVSPG